MKANWWDRLYAGLENQRYEPQVKENKVFKNFNVSWEDAWQGLAFVLVAGIIISAFIYIATPRQFQGYYLGEGEGKTTVCAKLAVRYAPDQTVFCSDDIGKVLLVVDGANRVMQRQ